MNDLITLQQAKNLIYGSDLEPLDKNRLTLYLDYLDSHLPKESLHKRIRIKVAEGLRRTAELIS